MQDRNAQNACLALTVVGETALWIKVEIPHRVCLLQFFHRRRILSHIGMN